MVSWRMSSRVRPNAKDASERRVDLGYDVYEEAAGGSEARRDYLQCAVLAEPARNSREALPNGGGRDRSGLD